MVGFSSTGSVEIIDGILIHNSKLMINIDLNIIISKLMF
jgi:hypothetical protein